MTAELIKDKAEEEISFFTEPQITSSHPGSWRATRVALKGENSKLNKHKKAAPTEEINAILPEVACASDQYLQMDNLRGLAENIAQNLTDILTNVTGEKTHGLGGVRRFNTPSLKIKKVHYAILRIRCLIRMLEHFCGKYQAEHRQIQISTVVKKFITNFNSQVPANINVTSRISNDLLMVSADPILIQKLLCCLCTNSVRAMGQNGGTLRITLASDTQEIGTLAGQHDDNMSSFVRLTIEDTGPGIPQCDHHRIFTPFFSKKGNKKLRGTGLSDVYGIVHCMGGRIYIKSKTGCGTAIEILFPVTKIKGDQFHAP